MAVQGAVSAASSKFNFLENSLGLVLDVKGESRNPGAEVYMCPKSDSPAQLWKLTTDGYLQCKLSGLVLTIRDGDVGPGAQLWLSEKRGDAAQLWTMTPDRYLQSLLNGLVLDTKDRRMCLGTEVLMSEKVDTPSQSWCLGPAAHFYYMESCSGFMLDIVGASMEEGASLCMQAKGGGSSQMWRLTPDGHLENKLNLFVLDITERNKGGGVAVCMRSKNGESSQLWNLTPDGYLQNRFNGLVLEVREGILLMDATLRIWAKTGESRQKWSLGPAADFHYLEHSLGMVLEAQTDNDGGVFLCVMPKSGKMEQLWRLTPEGHMQCKSNFSMLCIKKGSRIQGAKLGLSPAPGSPDQFWKYIPTKGYLQNKMTGLVLEIKGSSTKEGTEVWLWSKLNTFNQKWRLSSPEEDCSSTCQKWRSPLQSTACRTAAAHLHRYNSAGELPVPI